MATLNKVMLIGRLVDNPESKVLQPSGMTVVHFRFAVGRSKKNPETGKWENDPNPLFIDCDVWGRSDNTRLCDVVMQYAKKGSQLYIEGRLQFDTWEDKQNPGQKRSKHKIAVDSLQLLDTRGGEGEDEGRPAARGAYSPRGSTSSTGYGGAQMDDVGQGGGGHNPPDDGDIPF